VSAPGPVTCPCTSCRRAFGSGAGRLPADADVVSSVCDVCRRTETTVRCAESNHGNRDSEHGWERRQSVRNARRRAHFARPRAPERRGPVSGTLRRLVTATRETYEPIQEAALAEIHRLAPNAKVFVAGYPDITPSHGYCPSAIPWTTGELRRFRNEVQIPGRPCAAAGGPEHWRRVRRYLSAQHRARRLPAARGALDCTPVRLAHRRTGGPQRNRRGTGRPPGREGDGSKRRELAQPSSKQGQPRAAATTCA
jgi:hypothetical protein